MLKRTETVLIVDDEDTVLAVCEEMLDKAGCRVFVAKSGKEAVELYKKHKDEIDIIILDMIMPGVSGGEAYDKMKEINSVIKVLLCSGYDINGMASEILERGCDGFIQKPQHRGAVREDKRDNGEEIAHGRPIYVLLLSSRRPGTVPWNVQSW